MEERAKRAKDNKHNTNQAASQDLFTMEIQLKNKSHSVHENKIYKTKYYQLNAIKVPLLKRYWTTNTINTTAETVNHYLMLSNQTVSKVRIHSN